MNRSVIIHGPMPTPEQMADALGVSRSHLANLREVLEKDGFLHAQRAVQKSSAMKKRPRINEELSMKRDSASSLMLNTIVNRQAKPRRMSKKEAMQGSVATIKKPLAKSPSLETYGQEKIAAKKKSRGRKID